ncbi:galactokinase family protein [Planctomycetota bacterium]
MENSRGVVGETVVVILAAGKGTRAGRDDLAKVCFEIDSVPAINRMITTFKKKGFARFLVVVGSKAEQVLEVVSRKHPDTMYAFQGKQLGTGHAAKIAADALRKIGYSGNVLVTLGDKYVETSCIETLVDAYIKQHADFALLTIPMINIMQESLGRVLLDKKGRVLGIIERTDIKRQAIADKLKEYTQKKTQMTAERIAKLIDKHIPRLSKQAVAIPELLKLSKSKKGIDKDKLKKILGMKKYNLEIGGVRYSANQIEKKCHSNPSLYLLSTEAFYQGIGMIDNNNAQGEYYLPDIIKHLASIKDAGGKSRFRIRAVSIDNPDWIQGFNLPHELLAIQDHVRRKKDVKQKVEIKSRPVLKANQYYTVARWLGKIEKQSPGLKRWLKNIYGENEQLHRGKLKELNNVLNCYGKQFGFDEKVCIVRAPGRLNLMGRHVDHRGGFTNFMAIDRETIAVAGVRKDNNIVAVNTNPKQFKQVRFNISELIGGFGWSDWINFVNSDWVRNMLHSSAGDWGNYIKAAALRLQHQYQDVKVKGVNLAIYGNVPIAAGLSSSSTLVVATLQAAIALNNFELTSQQFIDLCGEGEWFVGSRGGAGDHAAIYLGQRGKIAQVAYLPFRAEKVIDAPKDYQIVIANSHVKAAKSGKAKDMFNARITSYDLGLALLKQRCPEVANNIEYLRDVNPEKLGCSISEIYRMLLKIPEFMTRRDFKNQLSRDYQEMMEVNFGTHAEPQHYNVRGVLLFGIAEIARSRMCIDYLEAGRMKDFGDLMSISHNGDRVSGAVSSGKYHLIRQSCSDEYLNTLRSHLSTEDPQKVLSAQLYMQSGNYACSTIEIDKMVDVACSFPGVVGAQITGAGLGGCIMIMVERDSVQRLGRVLTKNYYRPNKLKPAIIDCTVVEGAGLAEF